MNCVPVAKGGHISTTHKLRPVQDRTIPVEVRTDDTATVDIQLGEGITHKDAAADDDAADCL